MLEGYQASGAVLPSADAVYICCGAAMQMARKNAARCSKEYGNPFPPTQRFSTMKKSRYQQNAITRLPLSVYKNPTTPRPRAVLRPLKRPGFLKQQQSKMFGLSTKPRDGGRDKTMRHASLPTSADRGRARSVLNLICIGLSAVGPADRWQIKRARACFWFSGRAVGGSDTSFDDLFIHRRIAHRTKVW